jgi:YgiT-type zinc finger domain-containing protein
MTKNIHFERCPICNSKNIKITLGDFQFGKYTIPEIEYCSCESCGEKLTNVENEEKIDFYVKNHESKRKKVA